mmetsp:Transcript_16055/g.27349  ORF Transcript_16055/g.27349 Transcript_16055/m.27349 type:complete len:200 (+) Transcript_16055:985-1584(+)
MAVLGTAARSVGRRPAYSPARPSWRAMERRVRKMSTMPPLPPTPTPALTPTTPPPNPRGWDGRVVDSNNRRVPTKSKRTPSPATRYCGATRQGNACFGTTSPLCRRTAPRPRRKALTLALAPLVVFREENSGRMLPLPVLVMVVVLGGVPACNRTLTTSRGVRVSTYMMEPIDPESIRERGDDEVCCCVEVELLVCTAA